MSALDAAMRDTWRVLPASRVQLPAVCQFAAVRQFTDVRQFPAACRFLTVCRFFAACCFVALTAGIAHAQTALHFRGTLVKFDIWGYTPLILEAKARDGNTVTIHMAYNWEAFLVEPVDPFRVIDGSYIGVIAMPADGQSPNATSVLLYPDYWRGVQEGRHEWDSPPGSTMTNGTLVKRVRDRGAETWMLDGSDDTRMIRVGSDVPMMTIVSGGHNQPVEAGAPVFINATRQRDGTITAGWIFYGEKGFVPPM
jgi:hypothetical protein